MGTALQKAALWKRVAAWGLDVILLCIFAVGAQYGLTKVMDYDGCNSTLQAAYERYESQYGVEFDITQEAYLAMDEAQKQNYDDASLALSQDAAAMQAYDRMLNISLASTTVGILFAVLLLEFLIPLLLKNGQTLGKKAMALGVVRHDGVRMNTMQLLVRALLGKFTVETMIPVYLVLMMFWGIMDITGTVILCILAAVELCLCVFTRNKTPIHDLMAGTAVVDIAMQQVFESTEALIEYQKEVAAQRAARQEY